MVVGYSDLVVGVSSVADCFPVVFVVVVADTGVDSSWIVAVPWPCHLGSKSGTSRERWNGSRRNNVPRPERALESSMLETLFHREALVVAVAFAVGWVRRVRFFLLLFLLQAAALA